MQARAVVARAGEGVGLGRGDVRQEHVAVRPALRAIATCLLAITSGLLAVGRRPGATLRGGGAVGHDAPAEVLRGFGAHRRGVAGGELAIAQRRGPVARQGRQIAGMGDGVAGRRGLDALEGALVAAQRAARADRAGDAVDFGVTAVGVVAIAGRLIVIAGDLILFGRRLVGVRAGLIGVGQRLGHVGEGLLGRERDWPRGTAGTRLVLRGSVGGIAGADWAEIGRP